MQLRMDRYNNDNKEFKSRTQKNSTLYDDVKNSMITEFDVNSNVSVISSDADDVINVGNVKKYLDDRYSANSPKRKSIEIPDTFEEREINIDEDTKEYDINAILKKAKLGKNVDYTKERLKKVRDTQYEILNNLGISYIEKFNDIFNQIFLKLDKKMYLKLCDYMQEKDILISSTMIKDNWQFYLNIFTKEVCLGMLSYDTNCILEIDDYEKVISVQFRKKEYNSKELIKNIKSILR